jgi:hypothetical protein
LEEKTVKTGVDDLLALLKSVDKISLADAAHKLGISTALLQSWVDFLVEEEILGIEYKFTKPIIYMNKPPEEKRIRVKEESEEGLDAYKKDFRIRAEQRSIPMEKISFLWKDHAKAALSRRRDFFFREAKKRNLANADILWQEYTEKLLSS